MNDQDAVYCAACGKQMARQPFGAAYGQVRRCANCGDVLDADAVFCPVCGMRADAGYPVPVNHPRNMPVNNGPQNMGHSMPVNNGPQNMGRNMPVNGPQNMGRNVPVNGPQNMGQNMPVNNGPQNMQGRAPQNVPANQGGNVNPAVAAATAAAVQKPAGGFKNLYVISFLRATLRGHNIAVMIYMILNAILVGALFIPFFPDKPYLGILCGFGMYVISLIIAFSPIGEGIMRMQNECGPIKDPQIKQRMEYLFGEAQKRARVIAQQEGQILPDDIRLFMKDEDDINAFATGRKTVCFSKGLLALPDDQIVATLCHEFGHLTHHDTDQLQLIMVGNLVIVAIYNIMFVVTKITTFILNIIGVIFNSDGAWFMGAMGNLSLIMMNAFMVLWTKIGELLVNHSSRRQEYRADEFAWKCGMGGSLCRLLSLFSQYETKGKGVFAVLSSSHPKSEDRIRAIEALEAGRRGR